MTQNGVYSGGEGEGKWVASGWIKDGRNGEGTSVERKRSGVRGGEGDESGGKNGGGGEIEVEGEGDVGCQRVGGICV